MGSDTNDHSKKTTQTHDKPDTEHSVSSEAADTEWQINEQAIDQALEEQQHEIATKRQQQLEKIKEQESLFKDMKLVDDDAKEGLPCLNCKTPLKGPYCYECGQPDRHFIRFFPKVLWEMINEAFDFDSKIFRTLIPLLFSPGRLTLEYIAGRRARYINPLRMYIVISLVFFLVLSIVSNQGDGPNISVDGDMGVKSRITISDDSVSLDALSQEQQLTDQQRTELEIKLEELKQAKAEGSPIPDIAITQIEQALENGQWNTHDDEKSSDEIEITFEDGSIWDPISNPITFNNIFNEEVTQSLNQELWVLKNKLTIIDEDPQRFIEEVLDVLPIFMFFLLPIFALILKIFYIYKKRYYMEHLIVALHSHSFIFFSILLLILVGYVDDYLVQDTWLEKGLSLLFIGIFLWIPINLFLQQKRIYAQGKFLTTIKFIIVSISYLTLLSITTAAAAVMGVVNL